LNRWLLDTFTTWELGLIVVGGAVLIALAGLAVVHRLLPALRAGESNDVTGVILGVLAAIYGIVLAFVIVSLYDDFRGTKADIRAEASAVAMVYRDTRSLPPATADGVHEDIGRYIHTVTTEEWSDLAHGRENEQAWNEMDSIYVTLEHAQPKTLSQRVFYREAVAKVNDLMAARRQRLTDAEESIPPTFEILLVGGALLMIGFTLVFGVKSVRLHSVMVMSVAVLIGFNLLLALVLEFPYSGDVHVSPAPYSQGPLVAFAADAK
jgi:hypothetical protein